MSFSLPARPPCRAIMHLDLDAFYAQVEERRLGVPPGADVPFAVIQWGMIIAVNYAARKHGVARFELIQNAWKKCPILRAVHVQTFTGDGTQPQGYYPNPRKATHKVSLDAYRDTSARIFDVLERATSAPIQKASVDEAFFDLTEIAWQRLCAWHGRLLRARREQLESESESEPERTSIVNGVVPAIPAPATHSTATVDENHGVMPNDEASSPRAAVHPATTAPHNDVEPDREFRTTPTATTTTTTTATAAPLVLDKHDVVSVSGLNPAANRPIVQVASGIEPIHAGQFADYQRLPSQPVPSGPTFTADGVIDWSTVGAIQRDQAISKEEAEWVAELDDDGSSTHAAHSTAAAAAAAAAAVDEHMVSDMMVDDFDETGYDFHDATELDESDAWAVADAASNKTNPALFDASHASVSLPGPSSSTTAALVAPPESDLVASIHPSTADIAPTARDAANPTLLLLWFAAQITLEIRNAVLNQLDFHCSAGIAENKMLAKLASSLNKPNKQTTVTSTGAIALMRSLPLRKIRGLGGKLGREVCKRLGDIELAGEVWSFPLSRLVSLLGSDTGPFVYAAVRGRDSSAVVPRSTTKSMLAAKSFSPVVETYQSLLDWLRVLASELVLRMRADKRVPRTLKVQFHRASPNGRANSHAWWLEGKSRSCPLPHDRFNAELLASTAYGLLPSDAREILPCLMIALGAEGLSEGPVSESKSIAAMFKRVADRRPEAGLQDSVSQASVFDAGDGAQESLTHAEPAGVGLFLHASTPLNKPPHTAVADDDDGFLVVCPKCGVRTTIDEVDEHADYHVALAYQQQDRRSQMQQREAQLLEQQQQQRAASDREERLTQKRPHTSQPSHKEKRPRVGSVSSSNSNSSSSSGSSARNPSNSTLTSWLKKGS
ncbi:hypothetical protein CAOG_03918 [Capsaspora owczarzaki ATCC 30864]|uniref:DNA polymerase eta n=1 Tax=Capsaspora owczarzaki (strain ATCC 30864) TaxID=595528 RepID=A0A0D2WP61_CAPO3|nr:hypothetical protein CAOG_03918 [Capsaspora owczarzaki ATCC 30864]KJE93075.1 hypothetical protein CAOG_003918 [Capsaspora owczarzaki ATCC 30864]|eukprot:XP_004363646.1 hypothetical protein CAOG_03918 [Capsaspora owczarzaki ATCC 30864]